MRNKHFSTFFGALIFFLTTSAIVSVAVLIFGYANERFEGKKSILSLVMILTILFLAAICTVVDFVRRKITVDKPVDLILSATDRISSGDFSVSLKTRHSYGSYDEFDIIMENLNRMTAELGKNEIMKKDFISNVSHELKTPLSVIKNYAELIEKKNITDEDRRMYSKEIINASQKLVSLVNNILKLNKLENGSFNPEYERIRVDELLAESILSFEKTIESKNINLICDLEEISTVTSPGLLEIVFNNLISNAVKFTEDGGRISVKLYNAGEKLIVTVEDTGIGISKENGERIFERFYQADTSHSVEGNGLGLALVKKVIDIIGGEISVKSESGKGSIFTVVIKYEE